MFGKVIRLDNNEVTIENLSRKAISSLMNCHIVFEDEARKIVGEIIYIDEAIVKVLLVGEIVDNFFVSGIIKKPSGISSIRIITMPELELIFGKNELSKDNLLLGKSAVYNNLNITGQALLIVEACINEHRCKHKNYH